MEYKELISKTGCQLIGIVKDIQEWVSDKGVIYNSVFLELDGSSTSVKVQLAPAHDVKAIKKYELIKLTCTILPAFGNKGYRVVER